MEYVLETNGLCKRYKHFKALNQLNMCVPKGAIYGLVGKNGAGKTTLIRLLTGLQEPTDGSYTLFGVQNGSKGIARVRRRMGAVVETPSVYLDMTAEENLRAQFTTLGIPAAGEIPALLRLVGLSDTGKKKAKHFSLGMRQRLGIAVALAGTPDFLLLDEPMNGLDPQGIVEIRELILRLNRRMGMTVLVSSHILDELSRIATHYGFLDNGQMVREISAQELEATFQKRILLTVSDTPALARALEKLGLDYRITGENTAELYQEIPVTELSDAAKAEGCILLSMGEREESLESFYMNLVGGGRYA